MPPVNIKAPINVTLAVTIDNVVVNVRNDFQEFVYNTDLTNVFFNSFEFSESISYYHTKLGVSVLYRAMFDDPHTSFSMGNDMEVSNIRPQIMVSENDLRHVPVKGDRCVIRGRVYYVDDFQKDGVGVVTMFLRRN